MADVAQSLRRSCEQGRCRLLARRTIANLADLDLHRHPHLEVLTRARKLRENVTAYHAVYAALAEALDPPRVTCDRPLASTSGHRATIEVIA